MKSLVWTFGLFALFATKADAFEGGSPTVETLSTYSRITFPVNPKSTFAIRQVGDDSTQVLLRLEGYGNAEWSSLSSLSDERVKSVGVLSSSPKTRELAIALAKPGLEFFAYFQPSPAAVVIDVWPKGPGAATARKDERKPASVKAKPKQEAAAPKPASLSLSANFFHQFPMVAPPFVYQGESFDTVKVRPIDSGWTWTKPEKDVPGGLNFSLAQKLFGNKQYALTIKTIEFARRDYPEGRYSDEMEFLEAICYRRMGLADKNDIIVRKSDEKLQELMLREAQTGGFLPFASKIRIYFAATAYREFRWLDAISHLEFITSQKGVEKEQDFPGVVMAMAEAYFNLHQYRRAERIYRTMIQKSPESKMAMEAAYRLGNIHAHERAFRKADEAIRRAMREYPAHEASRPEAYFNLAESNFWLGNLAKAEEYYRAFVERHPTNTLGGYAFVRLGELAELLRGDQAKAGEHYVTAINRFPFSPGDALGRIRQARLEVFRESDPAFQMDFLKKTMETKELPTEVRHMAHETLIHYLQRSKQFAEAVQLSETGMGEAEGKGYEVYKRLFIDSLRAYVYDLNRSGKFDAVLALYKQKADWLDQIGPEINRELAEAYKGLGLISTSNQFLAKYLEAMDKQPKDRRPASLGRDRDDAILTRARTEFVQGRFGSVLETLSGQSDARAQSLKVRSLLKLERIEEARALAAKALEELKAAKEPKGEERDELTIDFTEALVARAEGRKDYREMESSLRAGIDAVGKRYERFEYMLGDSIWYQQKHRKAIEAYKKALEGAPKSSRADRAHYRMAMSHIALGERMEAVNILTKLRDGSQNIWSESARQELELLEWERKYSVILGDLPPMGLGLEN